MTDETRRREAMQKTAKQVRDAAAQNGARPMTQTDAEARVRKAVTRGDQIRDNDNR